MKFNVFALVVLFTLALSACGSGITQAEPQNLTLPAITVQVTKDNCPSIEVQAGMQVAWINVDSVDHILMIEHKDEQGVVTDSFGTTLLQPETTFSTSLKEPGQYTYYCSEDKKQWGTINVLTGE